MDREECERRVGSVLCGKWTLERLLGFGGMAAVYVGMHRIGRREAIKVLHREIASSPTLRARFEQEARAVNAFKHAGIVEVRDVDTTDDGMPFLVMELVEGETLAARLARCGPLEPGEMLTIADQLLDVLGAAHARGIVHRDIKPDNLLLEGSGRLKVLDFGIARVRLDGGEELRTKSGLVIGTSAYMPPEQIRGGEVDARADLFAVGATMFRLLSGRHLHASASDGDLLVRMATEPAPPLSRIASGVPMRVCSIVDFALRLDRDRRYPDAATMQADVRAVIQGEGPPFATADEPAPTVRETPGAGSRTLETPAPITAAIRNVPAWERGPAPVLAKTEAEVAADAVSLAPTAAEGSAVRVIRPPGSRLGVVPRLVLGLVAGALLVTSGLLLWAQIALVLKGRGRALGWVLFAMPAALGLVASWAAARGWRRDPSAEAARVVLRFARDRAGVATPSEIAADTSLTVVEAARALEDLARAGACRAVERPGGGISYRFDDFTPAEVPPKALLPPRR